MLKLLLLCSLTLVLLSGLGFEPASANAGILGAEVSASASATTDLNGIDPSNLLLSLPAISQLVTLHQPRVSQLSPFACWQALDALGSRPSLGGGASSAVPIALALPLRC
jgi:hypothetical protein